MWTALLYLAIIVAPFLFPRLFFRQSSEVERLTTGYASRIELINYPSAESESDDSVEATQNEDDDTDTTARTFTFNPNAYLASAETPEFGLVDEYADMPALVSDSDSEDGGNEPVAHDLGSDADHSHRAVGPDSHSAFGPNSHSAFGPDSHDIAHDFETDLD
jgi:hypothetical protein